MKMQKELSVYLKQILQAAQYIRLYTDKMDYGQFSADTKTVQAVVFNLFLIGENATHILKSYPEFAEETKYLNWIGMRGMRNRIAHGYFEMNLSVVWETVLNAIPPMSADILNLLEQLSIDEEHDNSCHHF
ncbi:HepT-like ribonuclease domain-containing protein [Neisseria polysaccharea]|uniref:HepT-like ribonuclease domain-containing protein n=1 Tax=Neisseria polysaccharea TaxID=489 RepID=UPI00272A48F7|nr:DUF86 domain-containing protein [Neisseria polysaccharea]